MNKLREAELRENVRIIVGGRPITLVFAETIGAEAYGKTAADAMKIARELVKEHKYLALYEAEGHSSYEILSGDQSEYDHWY